MIYYSRRCTALLTNCKGHNMKDKISSIAICSCRTRASVTSIRIPAKIHSDFRLLKRVPNSDLCIKAGRIGHGVFGNCFIASLGALQVCAKVFREACLCESAFCYEAVLISICCHANLPWLYGVILSPSRTIIQSYHSIKGKAHTIHSALFHSSTKEKISNDNWKNILIVASAVLHLHSKGILYNDIKSDNIVLDGHLSDIRSVLIDLGKGCFISDARIYKLSDYQKQIYKDEHPQIAPEVRDGRHKQSIYSDIYSLGRVVKKVNEKTLKLSCLSTYSSRCTQETYSDRPTSSEFCAFLSSL